MAQFAPLIAVPGMVRRCGEPTCHCAERDGPGHGPTLRVTSKARGKTIGEPLPTPVAVRKIEPEIAEFRKSWELSGPFVEIGETICRLRPSRRKSHR